MKLKFKNVGRIIYDTEIDINGITVLAGENGTGKSTIGKVLYCTFNTFHDYEEKIILERESLIYRLIRVMNPGKLIQRGDIQSLRKSIRTLVEDYSIYKDDSIIKKYLVDTLGITEEDNGELFKRTYEALNAEDSKVLQALLLRNIEAEFSSQLGHINYKGEKSEIELSIKDNVIKYLYNEGSVDIIDSIRLIKDIIYIDDPYVLDDLNNGFTDYGHKGDLIEKLRRTGKKELTVVDDVIANEKLQKIYGILEGISVGILVNNSNEVLSYSEKGLKQNISVGNISTGIRSFVILKTLLQNGFLEENGIVILDEPETHLNPEWMMVYAEIVVRLHELFGINFLISTHNSEFLSFIEYFTKKYKVESNTKYYWLSKNNSNGLVTDVEDVSEHLEIIYSNLSKSFLRISGELDLINEDE